MVPDETATTERRFMTSEPVSVHTDFGTITIGNELPDTVTLAVDDRIGAQRVIVMQIDEAYQVIDAVQNAIRDAIANSSCSSVRCDTSAPGSAGTGEKPKRRNSPAIVGVIPALGEVGAGTTLVDATGLAPESRPLHSRP